MHLAAAGGILADMNAAVYLIPVPLGETPLDAVLPAGNAAIVCGISHFVVENIRSARRFLVRVSKQIDIDALTFYELNEHTDITQIEPYLAPVLEQGLPVGVISEAGCPAVADPGRALVALAHRHGVPVVPLVGPSSIILAVMASGMSGQRFAFNGYLPAKPAERASRIRQLENRAWNEGQTQLFIEAPYRNVQLFESILRTCRKDTLVGIAAGLTTAQEYVRTMSVAGWKSVPAPEINKIPALFLLSGPHQQGV